MKQKQKLKTLDDLAEVMQRTMASKEDLAGVRNELNARIIEVDGHVTDLARDINKIDHKLEGIPSLAEFNDMKKRLERVEKKVGL